MVWVGALIPHPQFAVPANQCLGVDVSHPCLRGRAQETPENKRALSFGLFGVVALMLWDAKAAGFIWCFCEEHFICHGCVRSHSGSLGDWERSLLFLVKLVAAVFDRAGFWWIQLSAGELKQIKS